MPQTENWFSELKSREELIAALKVRDATIATVEVSLGKLTTQRIMADAYREHLESVVEELNTRILDFVEGPLDGDEYGSAKIRILESENRNLKADNARLEISLRELQGELDEMTEDDETDDDAEDSEDLSSQLSREIGNYERAEEEITKLKAKLAGLECDFTDGLPIEEMTQEQIRVNQIVLLRRRVREQDAVIADLRSSNQELTKSLHAESKKPCETHREAAELKKRVTTLQEHLAEVREELAKEREWRRLENAEQKRTIEHNRSRDTTTIDALAAANKQLSERLRGTKDIP